MCVPQLLQHVGQPQPRLEVQGRDIQELLVVSTGKAILAQVDIGVRPIVAGGEVLWVNAQHTSIFLCRILPLPQLDVHSRLLQPQVCGLWRQLYLPVEHLQRVVP